MLHPTLLPNPNPNVDVPWERPELDGLTRGIGLTLLNRVLQHVKQGNN